MTVKIELEIEIPEHINPTQKQIEEWIMYHVGYRSTLSGSNPLVREDLSSVITDCYVFDATN